MKNYARARKLLGGLLFLTELVLFALIASLLEIGVKETALFAGAYFSLLFYEKHFNFESVLIWHEVIELLRIHILYLAFCLLFELYLMSGLFMKLVALIVVMLFVSVTVERVFRLATRKTLGIRILVVGAGKAAEDAHILFHRNRFLYINPIAYVSLACVTGTKDSELIAQTATIIQPNRMEEYIKEYAVDELYVADNGLTLKKLDHITRKLRDKVAVIRYKPEMKDLLSINAEIASYDEDMFMAITNVRRSPVAMALRRVVDILAGLVGCLVLLPVTLAVKIGALTTGDKDSIFFTQERIGKDGKPIMIYKYRTMVPNAEQILEEMMERDPKIREEYLTNKKLDPDPRVTPFGQILRKTSLDELPQLLNVLKGEMSLIGPRPYLPREKEDMGFRYDSIVKFKPGLTGIWQASGRNNISFKERCKMDEYYYYHWSLWLDVMILVKTVKAVLLRDGAI